MVFTFLALILWAAFDLKLKLNHYLWSFINPMNMMDTNSKIARIREIMRHKGIDAVIVPSSDPHQSEYVAEHWKSREWISGFSGSAGTVVVTHDHAGLWTDSRYFIQAEEELKGSEFVLHKVLNYNPDFVPYLLENLDKSSIVGVDGNVFSISEIRSMTEVLGQKSIRLTTEFDLPGESWEDRPAMPQNELIIHDKKYTGASVRDKMSTVRKYMEEKGADYYFVPSLDDIAWLFNLRGKDIPCNPVFVSYAVLGKESAILFIDENKLDNKVRSHLQEAGVEWAPYGEIDSFLSNLHRTDRIYLSSAAVNYNLYNKISCEKIDEKNFIAALKSRKTEKEVAHIRHAMEKDGVALTRLYRWLDKQLESRTVSECEVATQLAAFRAEQEGYFGESFDAIVGYAANGAIIHYKPEENTCAQIKAEGILLLDSGGQYFDGTTDVTRTTALGVPTSEQKKHFTLVLKGHIAVDKLEFPEGSNGYQLDTFARQYLWQHGVNYFHGTGHGVGYFLNVHEGPQGISFVWSERSSTALETGMVSSNEPGFYKAGEYGIRIENLIVTRKVQETDFGVFLGHETLTLFPIDLQLIDSSLLNEEEIVWINNYHKMVFDRLSALLDDEERDWLKEKCLPIS